MPRLYKCKGMAGLYAPRVLGLMAANRGAINGAHSASDHCDCEPNMPLKRKKALTKKSVLQYSFTYFVQGVLLAQWLEVFFLMEKTKNNCVFWSHSIVGSALTYSAAVEFKSWLKVLFWSCPPLPLLPVISCLVYSIQHILIKILNNSYWWVSSKEAWKKLFVRQLQRISCSELFGSVKFKICENKEKVFYTFKIPQKIELVNIYYNIMNNFRYLYVAKLYIAKIKEVRKHG